MSTAAKRPPNIESEVQSLESELEISNQMRAQSEDEIKEAERNFNETSANFEQRLTNLQQESTERENYLKAKLALCKAELESVQEFQTHKGLLEEDLHSLNASIQKARILHKETIDKMNEQMLLEKYQYERQHQARVRQAEARGNFTRKRELEDDAYKAMQEQIKIAGNLKKNETKTKDFYSQNHNLLKKIDEIILQNRMIEDREQMLKGDLTKLEKQHKILKKKVADLDVKFAKDRADLESNYSNILGKLDDQIESVKKENSSLKSHIEKTQSEIAFYKNHEDELLSQQAKYVKLLASTNTAVSDSIRVQKDEPKSETLASLIHKLNVAIEDAQTPPASTRKTRQMPFIIRPSPDKFF